MIAVSVARDTCAFSIAGTVRSASVTWFTHAAHVMPFTCSVADFMVWDDAALVMTLFGASFALMR